MAVAFTRIAHRGYSDLALESTLAAFNLAWHAGFLTSSPMPNSRATASPSSCTIHCSTARHGEALTSAAIRGLRVRACGVRNEADVRTALEAGAAGATVNWPERPRDALAGA